MYNVYFTLQALNLKFSNLSLLLLKTFEHSDLDATQLTLAYHQPPLRIASWRRAARDYAQTKRQYTRWIHHSWPKWDDVSAGTRNVGFRSSTLLCVKETRAFTTSRSLVISVFLPFFFLSCDNVTLPFLVVEFGSAFPTRGIVCDDLWLRSVRTSQHHRYIHANSCPMLEANQDGTCRFPSPPASWIRMNIDQRSFIDLRGHQDALYVVTLIVAACKSMSSISTLDRQEKKFSLNRYIYIYLSFILSMYIYVVITINSNSIYKYTRNVRSYDVGIIYLFL